MSDRVTIHGRFNGPRDSANGGVACGTAARFIDGPAEVTLRVPPPLDHPLEVVGAGTERVELRDGETLVAEAQPVAAPQVEPPVRPTVAEAQEAQSRHPYIGISHPFSHCFVCGYGRDDGMHLSFGPLAARPDMNAAVLRPDPSLPHRDGALAPEIVWGALDCPSYTPDMYDGLAVLGRLTAAIERQVDPGETLVAVGWPLETEGRKHHTASALIDDAGRVVARARALWIAVEPR